MAFQRPHPRQRRTCEEYKAELEEENYHLRSELQTEVDSNCQNERRINQLERDYSQCKQEIQDLNGEIKCLENTSEEEISELKQLAERVEQKAIVDLYQLRTNAQNQINRMIGNMRCRANRSLLEYNRDRLYERYEKWKNKTQAECQNILNLQGQIFALQNNLLHIEMAGYAPKRFLGRADEDIDKFVKDYRLYLMAANINTDEASCWVEDKLIDKKWQLNHALNNANITTIMINVPDNIPPPALPAGATDADVISAHNVHTDEDWSLAKGYSVNAETISRVTKTLDNSKKSANKRGEDLIIKHFLSDLIREKGNVVSGDDYNYDPINDITDSMAGMTLNNVILSAIKYAILKCFKCSDSGTSSNSSSSDSSDSNTSSSNFSDSGSDITINIAKAKKNAIMSKQIVAPIEVKIVFQDNILSASKNSSPDESSLEEESLDDPMKIYFIQKIEPKTSVATVKCKIKRLKIPAMTLDSGAEPPIITKNIVDRIRAKIDKTEKYNGSSVATVPIESMGVICNLPITLAPELKRELILAKKASSIDKVEILFLEVKIHELEGKLDDLDLKRTYHDLNVMGRAIEELTQINSFEMDNSKEIDSLKLELKRANEDLSSKKYTIEYMEKGIESFRDQLVLKKELRDASHNEVDPPPLPINNSSQPSALNLSSQIISVGGAEAMPLPATVSIITSSLMSPIIGTSGTSSNLF
ncbi:hypothetical protein C1645_813413 [Glomus cerebriforme]|uniref:Uncharacterized protein n=1 Tax=Glomus cerebriforme TaxID=658196 RepID=A0A397TIG1_9GLOM|nr:hypothetical protein C1645_813413 [Glomus cerebriforme]